MDSAHSFLDTQRPKPELFFPQPTFSFTRGIVFAKNIVCIWTIMA